MLSFFASLHMVLKACGFTPGSYEYYAVGYGIVIAHAVIGVAFFLVLRHFGVLPGLNRKAV